MSDKEKQSLDIFGIKPIGDAANTLVRGTVEGAAAFLSRICLPAAEEFGFLLRDRVSHWRTQNFIKITEKAEKKYQANFKNKEMHMHPRLLSLLLEQGSWIESDDVQEMWAGLLVSSCTEDGKDDSNLIFMNLLSQMTTLQAKIINHACEKADKRINKFIGNVFAKELKISSDELVEITGISDIHRLDREMDHLRSLELFFHFGGFQTYTLPDDVDSLDKDMLWVEKDSGKIVTMIDTTSAIITPTSLCLSLYVRCQGSSLSPIEYFKLTS